LKRKTRKGRKHRGKINKGKIKTTSKHRPAGGRNNYDSAFHNGNYGANESMGWGIQDWRDHWKKKFGKGGKVEMNPTQVMCVGFDAGENVEGVRIDRMVKGVE
jgi:hypothetical protein